MTLELIKSEALKLARLERLELIRSVLDSIALEESGDLGITEDQLREIKHRLKRFDSGESRAIPGEVAHSEIARKYGLQLSTPS